MCIRDRGRSGSARVAAGDLTLAGRSRPAGPAVGSRPLPVFDRAGRSAGNPAAASAVVTPRSSWDVDLASGARDLGLAFDYRFLRGGGAALLTVRLDGDVRAVAGGGAAGRSGQRLVIDVGGIVPGRHRLSVGVARSGSPGEVDDRRGPAVAIGGFRMLGSSPGLPDRRPGPSARAGAVAAAALVLAAGLAGTVAAARARGRSH